jgi:hypothetical protein
MKMQGYNGSQCWDTSFAVQAVHAAGLCSEFPVMIARAHAFLERTQILSSDTARATAADSFEAPAMRRRYFRHTSRGGWPFSTSAHGWPISDCTAEGECNWPNLSTVVVRMVARGGGCRDIRVRVEILGSQKRRIVGKSQSVVIMINPIIFTRTRMYHMYCQHVFVLLCGGAVPRPVRAQGDAPAVRGGGPRPSRGCAAVRRSARASDPAERRRWLGDVRKHPRLEVVRAIEPL